MRSVLRLSALVIVCFTSIVLARNPIDNESALFLRKAGSDDPYYTLGVHNIGKVALTVTNFGVIGTGGMESVDPLTGTLAPSLSYPQGYDLSYLYRASLWVGAAAGRDSLVSVGSGLGYGDIYELWPYPYPDGDMVYRSNLDPEAAEYDSAVSNQDFLAEYTDTNTTISTLDYHTGESHKPLGIKVMQRSYAWGYDYAEDFVIFDLSIVNIGEEPLEDVYIGLHVDNDCGVDYHYNSGDDICGFLRTARSGYIENYEDTINVAWAADNDGDPGLAGLQGVRSPTSIVATKILRTPSDSLWFNFNWWASSYFVPNENWGPRKRPQTEQTVRQFHGVLGTPFGDADKYYMMSQDEFDYNQETVVYDHSSDGWLPPPSFASNIVNGAEVQYVLSCGPFSCRRGEILPFTFAIVCGQYFYDQDWRVNPYGYTKWRDPSDLALNTVWATWIYDNPGVDTDGDGYKGKYYITVFDSAYVEGHGWVPTSSETLFYKGDGVPDFRGASPPPPPELRVSPKVNEYNIGEIEVRWNGRVCETTPDQFSQDIDFEGYRVYLSLSDRDDDFILYDSYDRDNYDRWEYHIGYQSWVLKRRPFDLSTLRAMYGENFEPLDYYDINTLFRVYDANLGDYTGYFFSRHDWNESNLRDTMRIHKIYPDQSYPSTFNLDSAAIYYPDELTDDGYLKYFEYRYVFRNLLPSQEYYVSVTTFDHGYAERSLTPQETSPTMNDIREFAQNNSRLVEENGLNVIVYPNPYRVDANYYEHYEGWEHPDLPIEFNRALHFTNLPHKCTIRIFSIDGDLVRTIEHDYAEGESGSMHDKWDLISRNRMIAVSGIYYYSVESALGNQVGKIVIIR